MNKLYTVVIALFMLNLATFSIQAQHYDLEASLKKEITTYQQSFTQKVIFDISRYFKFRGKVLPEITRHFRGIKVTRRQPGKDPAYFEFIYKKKTLYLSEPEVRKLVGLGEQVALKVAASN